MINEIKEMKVSLKTSLLNVKLYFELMTQKIMMAVIINATNREIPKPFMP